MLLVIYVHSSKIEKRLENAIVYCPESKTQCRQMTFCYMIIHLSLNTGSLNIKSLYIYLCKFFHYFNVIKLLKKPT